MNNVQKKYFIGLTHFLGNVLGPKYEVVFHSFDKNKAHMEAIANSIPKRSFEVQLISLKMGIN